MKLFLCAGETSGDQHAASLLRELKALRPDVAVSAIGGPALAAEGAELLTDLTRIAPIGIVEVLKDLNIYRKAMDAAEAWCAKEKPSAAVLLDFPDFNLRLAARLKKLGIPVVYYISPQVWAWRPGRVKEIARVVTKMLVLFDFEEEIYRKAGVDVEWVGHPLADSIGPDDPGLNNPATPMLGLLPGSRPKEVARLFPLMLEAFHRINRHHPVAVAAAPASEETRGMMLELCDQHAQRVGCGYGIGVLEPGSSRRLMKSSTVLLIASGTATLEASLYGTPMVVVYKVSPATALMGKALLRLKEFSLANILSGGGTVPECIQGHATPERVAAEALALLKDPARREVMSARLGDVRKHLGPPGASRRAAEAVLSAALRS